MLADLDDLLHVFADELLRTRDPSRPGHKLLAASDGMPIAFSLAPAYDPERGVVAAMLEGIDLTPRSQPGRLRPLTQNEWESVI